MPFYSHICLVLCVLLVSEWVWLFLVWSSFHFYLLIFSMVFLKIWSMLLIWDSSSLVAIIWRFWSFHCVPYFLHVPFICFFKFFIFFVDMVRFSTSFSNSYILSSTCKAFFLHFLMGLLSFIYCVFIIA